MPVPRDFVQQHHEQILALWTSWGVASPVDTPELLLEAGTWRFWGFSLGSLIGHLFRLHGVIAVSHYHCVSSPSRPLCWHSGCQSPARLIVVFSFPHRAGLPRAVGWIVAMSLAAGLIAWASQGLTGGASTELLIVRSTFFENKTTW